MTKVAMENAEQAVRTLNVRICFYFNLCFILNNLFLNEYNGVSWLRIPTLEYGPGHKSQLCNFPTV